MKFKKLPPLEIVLANVSYDQETGTFRWATNIGRCKSGTEAGSLNSYGYVRLRFGGDVYFAHRIAWLIATSKDPGDLEIDHINRMRSDNRLCNLRLATRFQNCQNTVRDRLTEGIRGVYYETARKRWRAYISVDNRRYTLGLFMTMDEAVRQRTAAEQRFGKVWAQA